MSLSSDKTAFWGSFFKRRALSRKGTLINKKTLKVGALIRKGALIGRRVLIQISTVHNFLPNAINIQLNWIKDSQ